MDPTQPHRALLVDTEPQRECAQPSKQLASSVDKSVPTCIHSSIIKRRWLLISKMDLSTPLPSPCVSVCQVNEQSICVGCQRSIEEIAGWSSFDAEHQLQIWKNLIKRLDEVTTN